MKIAVIDMGTNTFHLLIVDVKTRSSFQTIYREKTAVKIGKDGINKGFITPEAQQRALTAIRHFKNEIDKQNVERVYATATSAIRNANNGAELVSRIKSETGIEARVISGLEEAKYIHFGVTHALTLTREKSLIMDIGGGSIEFIIANSEGVHWLQSFEIGGQRMVEKFHQSEPITAGEISELEKFLFEELTELFDACAEHRPTVLIGSSGTFDTLSEIYVAEEGQEKNENLTELPFDIESFEKIYQNIVSKNREERLEIPGMIPLRVDMIVVATVLVKFILDSLDLRKIRISAYALKEGVLLKAIDSFLEETKVNS
jgi:exopolyphosphatase/guanosine-5'-triphosphate,3'-diphosphate pyrophosphatase